MAGEEAGGEEEVKSVVGRWREVVESRWRKAGEHAEAYPYVWGSYILVYGGLGAFVAYKWRKLRRMEARVKALQERARKKAEAAEQAAAAPTGTSSPSKSNKPGAFPPLP